MPKNLRPEHTSAVKKAPFGVRKLTWVGVLYMVFSFLPVLLHGQVVVTKATDINDLCVGGDFKSVGNIRIAESAFNDIIDNGTGFTYILEPDVSNFEFNPGVGSVAITAGDGLANISMVVTATRLTIQFDHDNAQTTPDEITISGLEVKAITTAASGNFRRTGGTSDQTGNNVIDANNHLVVASSDVTLANAGVDQQFCGSSATLDGNPIGVGTGSWSKVSGAGGSFDNNTLFNTDFNGTQGTTYVLRWSATNGGCVDEDDVTITMDQNATSANAGSNITLCGTTSSALGGNTPVVGTGLWTEIAGDGLGAFVDPTDEGTTFIGTLGQTYTLQWTITNSTCSSSDVMTFEIQEPPSTANAGSDQALCGTSATLSANTPTVGAGLWSIVSGGAGSFTLASDPGTDFSGTAGSVYTLRWTISNGTCTPSTDDVVITFDQNPTVSAAGSDQTLCGTGTSLSGNVPVIGTGQWSFAAGGNPDGLGIIADINSASSGITGTAGVSYTLRWTISNGTCTPSTDDVVITFDENPTVSNAGSDQALCGTSATLSANTPTVGSGLWSIVSGGAGSFTLASDPGTDFSGTVGSVYTLRWTISNGTCTPSTDDVVITFDENPTVSNAGSDQTLCGTSTSLTGNVPVIGTGQWSFAPGGNPDGLGIIADINSASSGFTGTAGVSYTLRWTISNGTCTPSTDDVVINFDEDPTVSNAGSDQALCGTSATLSANTPTVGSGLWSIVSGGPGSFTLASDPGTDFSGTVGSVYTLRWTISNGTCTPSTDDVVITFDQNPTVSAAGSDQTLCGTSTSLTGNVPLIGTGQWSFAPGGNPDGLGIIADINSASSGFTGTAGVSYTLRWTISNGTCTPSTDDVVINFDEDPTVSNAGSDQALCGTSATLSANTPTVGSGLWSIVSGGAGSFTLASDPGTDFSGTAGSVYTLRWTISNGTCTPSTDDVVITFDQNPTVSAAGSDQTLCGTSTSLTGNVPVIGTGQWSFAPGGNPDGLGIIADINSASSGFTGTAGVSYTLRWTISNGTCTPSTDDVVINFDEDPTVSNAGSDQALCGTSATLSANTPTVGSGLWSIVSGGPGSFTLASDPGTDFSGTVGSVYTLRWTISNGTCTPSTDDVVITFDQNPTVSAAGSDQTLCGTSTSLTGNVPVIGTGQWSFAAGGNPDGLGIIADINSASSGFTGTAGVSYTLRWTISNGTCTPSTDDVVINFDENPTVSNAGSDQALCGTSATLSANTPTVGTGLWSIVSGGPGSFTLASDPGTDFSGTVGSVYTLRWTISNGTCTPSTDDVVITFDQNPTVSAAGSDQTLCGTSTSLTGNVPVIGTGQWSFAPGGNPDGLGIIADINSASSGITGTAGVSYTLRWTISNGTCTPSTDDVVINFDADPTVSNAGSDQALCGTSATLSANTPTVGTGLWSIVSGGAGSFTLASDPGTDFSGTAGSVYTLRWTISNGTCTPSTDDVVITFDENPTVSAAGSDQTLCGTSTSLTGNVPVIGTGQWSFAAGGNPDGLGIIADINSASSGFTGTAGVSYTLRWTISNGTCTPSTDDVVITFDENPTVSNAGSDQALCGTSATLSANTPTVGAGLWSIVSGGPGSFTLASDPGTDFSGTVGSVYTLRWTISNGTCTPSTDDVVITFDENPTVSNAGSDQTLCGTSTSLTGNVPVIGTGQWSFAVGGNPDGLGIIADINSASSGITGTAGVSYTLRWTISNGTCTPSTDDVVITFDENPTVSNAGSDQALCGTSATLSANTPTVGTGSWSIVSGGPGSFTLASDPGTDFSGTVGSVYTLRWTISNGTCTPSTDDVVITFDQNPTVSAAGSDQTLCGTGTSLSGNVPVIGTGQWSFAAGGNPDGLGIIADINSASSGFTGTAGVSYTLRWTISNGTCTPSTDDVVINFDENPTVSNAGSDQALCGTSATLSANTPTVGTGLWSIVSGGAGSFTLASDPGTDFSGTAGSVYTLRWTISNGTCTPSTDDVVITFDQNPTVSAAGSDQTLCGTSTSLTGNVPLIGTGQWSFAAGGNPDGLGIIADINSASSGFTGTAGVSYTLRWTISNGTCTPSTDDVVITFDENPTVSNAGSDQALCGTSATLSANTPTVGTGLWSIVSGGAGSFTLASDPGTDFSGTAGSVYTLRWTISNGTCTPSTDDVVITFDENPTVSAAGSDQTLCGTSTSLTGNVPVIGTGQWSFAAGGNPDGLGIIADINSASSGFTGTAGVSYTLRWTISNGTCTPSTDDVVITFDENPTVSAAGSDQALCGTSATLSANTPTVGTGLWSIVSGGAGSFTLASDPGTDFSGTAGSVYTLRWTISNGTCTPSTDDVVITFDENPTVSAAGSDQTLCGTSTSLTGNVPVIGTGQWSFAAGGNPDGLGIIADINSASSGFTGTAGVSYTLRWTISNGTCTPSTDDVVINFDENPTVSNAGSDQALCGTSATLSANTPTVGTGLWSIVSGGAGSFTLASDPGTDFSGTAGSVYTLRWTISNGTCTPSTDDVVITFDQNPTVSAAGSDQTLCGTSTSLTGNVPLIGTGQWSFAAGGNPDGLGIIADINSASSGFTGTAGVSYTLRWTISNGTCTPSTDDVVITFDENPTVSNAGSDQALCGTSATLSANTPTVGTGLWSIVSGGAGSFTLASDPGTDFSGTAGSVYTLRWTISNGTCTPSTDDVVITFDENPTVSAAGSDQTLCGTSTSLTGNVPVIGTGQWSFAAGGNPDGLGIIADINSASSGFTGTAGVSYTLRWTISNGTCTPSTDDVVITFDENPTVSAAGSDQALCGTSATLSANTPTVGTGLWSIVSGGAGSFTLASDPGTDFSGTAGSVYTLRWTISNGTCTPSTDDVVITFDENPTVSAAGSDQTLCGTSTSLTGNVPVIGTGQWSFAPGGNPDGLGIIADINSASSGFTGTAGVSYTLRWTISNGTCTPSTDDVVITFDENPTVSAAGSDQALCGTSATLSANTPTVGTGLWSIVSGGAGSFTLASDPGTDFSGTAGSVYTLRWTISNGTCTPSTDDVVITFDQNPTVSAAGSDQTLCGTSTSLTGNVPLIGTGQWSFAAGGNPDGLGIIADINSASSGFTGTAGVSYTLRWTISNGTCTPSTDDVVINFDADPTVSNAGSDQALCGTSATLSANTPTVGTGLWSIVSGGAGSFTLASDPGTDFSGTAGSVYTLRWTISNGTCTPSTDDVVITFDENPTVSAAGSDQTLCGTSTSLTGNVPVIGTGQWSFAAGGNPDGLGIIADINSASSGFTGTAGVSYTLRWTISNGTCTPSTDDVVINFDENPTVSNAGSDQALCGTSATLSANTPTVGTGLWSIVSGGAGSFTLASDPGTDFSGTAGSVYTLRWTISNGTCTPSTDDVVITFDENPTVSAAGSDQTLCGTGTSLSGNVPVIGTGQWSFAPGGNPDGLGIIADINSASSGITGTAGVSYTLRWTISNGTCTPSTDDVVINFDENPTVSNAGSDQALCGTSATLSANTPTVGAGLWSIVSGGAGSFTLASDPGTDFSGTAGSVYTLRWTISNGTCTPSTDDVVITFDQNPTVSAAGADQFVCGNNTLLTANVPSIGIGQWSIINTDGAGVISDINSASTNFTGSYGFNYVLRWTISNGVCANSTNDVNIQFNEIPVANAIPGTETICNNTTTNISLSELVGHPGTISYDWMVVYDGVTGPNAFGQELSTDVGGPVISETLTNTGILPGTATFTITATNGAPFNCVSNPITVVVTVTPEPSAMAVDQTICSGTTSNVSISDPSGVAGTTFSWTVLNNTNVIGASSGTGALIVQTLFSADVVSSGSVTYEITPNANGCDGPVSTVTVSVDPTPAIMNTPLELINTICSGTTLGFTPNATVVGTTYSWTSSITGTIDGASITVSGGGTINDTPINTGNSLASVIYTITPFYSGCAGAPVNYIVFVEPIPTVDAPDQTICSGELSNVVITNPNGVIGTAFDWVVSNITGPITGASDGSGSLISQTLINSSAVPGSVTYRITPTASGCSGSPFDVVVTVDPLPTVNAGIDIAICEGENAMLNGTIGGAATVATWTSSDGMGTFSPNNNDLNATFIPDASQIGNTITLTLTTNDPTGPCVAAQSSISLTINALPVVSFGGLNPEYAVNEPTVPLFGSPSGGIFTGPGIVSGLSFSPFEAGVGDHLIQYNYTDPSTNCSNSSAPQSVRVNPLPDVGIPGLGATDFCFDDPDFPLVGDPVADGINTFGVFSGPGVVNNDLFTPSLAGVGTHVIRYTYTDENSATNFTDVVVNVRDLPVADFGVFNSCDGEVVNFTDLSTIPNPSNIVRWEWDFGDNSPIDNAQNPSHLYAAPGTYNITLTVESNFGCRSSTSADLEIGAFPITKFSWERICFGDATRFTDNTFFSSGIIASYSWDFGDPITGTDNTSDQQNPFHVFSAPGWYDVSLTVTTGIGCMRTVTERVFILPSINANAYPYTESFENGTAGWVAEGTNNSWEWGVPAANMVINSAADGANAWVTNLNGSYNSGEKSWVNTPCFDFSTIERPMIAFKIWSHTEDQKSGAIVECSTDGGLNWTVLGDNSGLESVEWYNSSAIIGSPSSPGNVNIGDLGWSGKEAGWKEVKHSLDEFKGNSSVRFRITFGADLNDPNISGLNGFAFDDFYIGERSKVILLEHFTNNSQTESTQSNVQMADLVSRNGGEVFNINYHTSFPGFDLFNQANTADPSARRLYYGLSEPPNVIVNGEGIFKLLNASNTAVLQDSIDNFSLETPLFNINLTLPPAGNSILDINATVTATDVIPPGFDEELVVHTAIIETEVSGIEGIPPGVIYYNVMKKLLPDASGNTINRTWNVNDTEVINESWVVERAYDPTKLAVIVFVQNKDSKRIYQAAYLKAPDKQNATVTGINDYGQTNLKDLIIYPQPASDQVTLELDQSLQNDYAWKITDQQGVIVKEGKIDRRQKRVEIPTGTFVSGMYFIILENKNKEVIRRKLVIVRK